MWIHWTNAVGSKNVLWLKRKLLIRQKQVSVSSNKQNCINCITYSTLQNKMNISRSLKYVNVLKVLRRLFQNWHLTQKRPKMKLSAHKWGGGRFCGRLGQIFWAPPDLFERRLRRPLAAALDWRRALKGRPQAAGFAGIKILLAMNLSYRHSQSFFRR